jgi:nitrogen regulatory protein P-II 1
LSPNPERSTACVTGEDHVKLITAIVEPFKLDDMKEALKSAGVSGMTASEASGFGRRRGPTLMYRGSEYTADFPPKVRLEMVVADRAEVERVVNILAKASRTGEVGAGKVWVTDIEWVVSLRTGEMNLEAL